MREERYIYPFMYIAGRSNMVVKKHIFETIYELYSKTPPRETIEEVRKDMKESIMKVIKVQ